MLKENCSRFLEFTAVRIALFHITARRLTLLSSIFFGLIFNFFVLKVINENLSTVDFPNEFLYLTMPILIAALTYFSLSVLVLPKTAKPILFGLMIFSAIMYSLASNGTVLHKLMHVMLVYSLPVFFLIYTRINFEHFSTEFKKRFLRCCVALLLSAALIPSSFGYLKILADSNLLENEITHSSQMFYKYVHITPSPVDHETLQAG